MTSGEAPGNRPANLSGLLRPGTLSVTTPAAASTAAATAASTLPARPPPRRPARLRRAGRCNSGRSRIAGGGVGEGADGLCREKFMEGLPFVEGQGAEVAVEFEAVDLVLVPPGDQVVLLLDQRVLEPDQVGR